MIVVLCKKLTSMGPLFYSVIQMYGNCVFEQIWTSGRVQVLRIHACPSVRVSVTSFPKILHNFVQSDCEIL